VQEGDGAAVGAVPRLFVDETDTVCFEPGEFSLDISDPVGGVMQLRWGVAAEVRDRRVFFERAQQFDDRIAAAQANHFDALIGDDLPIHFAEAERSGVEPGRRFEVGDDNRDMVDRSVDHTLRSRCGVAATMKTAQRISCRGIGPIVFQVAGACPRTISKAGKSTPKA
jgi:hypothetical protein